MKLFKKTKKGFTLVELVVVIAVIAILSAVSVGAYFGITDSANNSRLEQEAEQIHTAIQAVSLGTDSNQSLGKDGLRVKDPKHFELALEENLGTDVVVATFQPSVISAPTIVLSNNSVLLQEHNNGILYQTFDYMNPEIGGKKIVADVVTGDTKIHGATFTFNKDAEEVETKTVNFQNNWLWTDVTIHYWGEGFESGFPGERMSLTHNDGTYDYYVANIPETATGFLFTGLKDDDSGTRDQSPDISVADNTENFGNTDGFWYMHYDAGNQVRWGTFPTETPDDSEPVTYKRVYYANTRFDLTNDRTMKAYSWNSVNSDNNGAFPGQEMTADAVEHLYYIDVDETFDKIIFSNKNSDKDSEGVQTGDLSFEGYSETLCFWNGTAWAEKPTEVQVDNVEETTVHFVNTAEWNEVYVYYYGSSFKNSKSWPGNLIEDPNGTIYTCQVPSDVTNFIFNNNDGEQTENLTFVEGNPYYVWETEEWAASYTPPCETHAWSTLDGVCTVCQRSHTHTWNENVCETCNYTHTDHEELAEGAECPVCDYVKPIPEHVHDWSNNDGVCADEKCNYECTETHEIGVKCDVCNFVRVEKYNTIYLRAGDWKNDNAQIVAKFSESSNDQNPENQEIVMTKMFEDCYKVDYLETYSKVTLYRKSLDGKTNWNTSSTYTIDTTKPCFYFQGWDNPFNLTEFSLGLVGANNGWGADDKDEVLTLQDDKDTYLLENCDLVVGEYKIRLNNLWDSSMGYNYVDDTSKEYVSGPANGNFKVDEAGKYNISFKISTGRIYITPVAA